MKIVLFPCCDPVETGPCGVTVEREDGHVSGSREGTEVGESAHSRACVREMGKDRSAEVRIPEN